MEEYSEHKIHSGHDGRETTEGRNRHTSRKLYFGVCIVPTNMTFTTDLVTCIVIYVPLLISPELPNIDKADAQKRLQLTTLKKDLALFV
jgi:hypothetical protein